MHPRIFIDNCDPEIIDGLAHIHVKTGDQEIPICMAISTLRKCAEISIRKIGAFEKEAGRNITEFKGS